VGKSHLFKRGLIAGVAVLILGGAAVGVAAAQAQPSTPTQTQGPRQKFLEALASRLHVSVDQLNQAITGARQDAGLPARDPNAAHGRHGVRPGFLGRGAPFGAFLGKEADAVAALFKESTTDLRSELPGNTLADLATKHGVKSEDVVNTIVKVANDQLNQTAQSRNITADRVSQIKQQISERAQQFVTTHRFPARGSGTRS
jgi:DNA-binding transcriptional regulator YdaS (Cro superfamily)